MADSTKIDEREVDNARKTASGENVVIGKSATVFKNPGETLVIYESVSDKDSGFDGADETASFNLNFSETNNWGAGPIEERISHGPLDVTVYGRVDLVWAACRCLAGDSLSFGAATKRDRPGFAKASR